jgi:hypothetical protein
MKCSAEKASNGMIHIYLTTLMAIGSGIRIILMVIPKQFERPQC